MEMDDANKLISKQMSSIIPQYKIAFKNQSLFMKILGTILFFNKDFMTHFITTIGSTIYFPSPDFLTTNPGSSKAIIVHENVHIKDSEKYSQILFSFSYLFPQILAILSPILFFFIPWFLALPIALLFLFPLPALFRAMWEKKAYTFTLYAYHLLETKYGFTVNYDTEITNIVSNFKSANYYFMLPWMSKSHFEDALSQFKTGNKPFYDIEYYNMADELLDLLMKT